MKIKRHVYIVLGLLCVALGGLGVVVPGLPTTPFLLLASWLFYRSSPSLRQWLLDSWLGRYIRDYERDKGMSWSTKITAMTMMLVMCSISIIFFIPSTIIRIVVGIAGLIGLIVVGWVVPTRGKQSGK